MPLDIAGFVLPKLSSFDQLGLLPIAEDRAERWRGLVTAEFVGLKHSHQYLVTSGRAHWTLSTGPEVKGLLRSAPADVRHLAREVGAVPGAKLGVQWFYTDPLLYVIEGRVQHCMAIWHRGIVRALADGARLSRTQKLLRRFAQTV